MKKSQKIKTMSIEVKASLAYTICSVIQKSLSFITLPLFARILTTAQYGQYTIYSSWMALFSIFITLELPYGTFNTAMTNFKDDRDGYAATAQTICTMFTLLVLVIYLPLRDLINQFLELPTFLVIVMLAEILFQSAFLFWCGKKRFEYKYISIIVVTLLITFISPALATLFVFNTEEKGYARILGYSCITIAFGLIFYIINYVKGKKLLKKEYCRYALAFNIPLLIYYVAQIIFGQSDRIMINYFCGIDKAGIYGVAYNLSVVLTFLINSINNAYTPWLYAKINEEKPKDNKKISVCIAILIAVLLSFIIWLAPEIIWVMAGTKYTEAIWIVPPVASSVLLLLYTQYFTSIEFLYKKRFSLIIAAVIPAVVNIGLNYIFIPRFGYLAAGYTTFASYILFALVNYLCICRYLKKGAKLNGLYSLRSLILIFTIFLLVNIAGMLLYRFMIVRFLIMFIGGILLIVFWKRIYALINLLKHKEVVDATANKEVSQEA